MQQPLPATLWPLLDNTLVGHYRVHQAGDGAAKVPVANALLANLRNPGGGGFAPASGISYPHRLLVVTRIEMAVTVVTAVTAQRIAPVDLVVARDYTVDDTVNSTLITPGGRTDQLRKEFPENIGTIRVCNTSAGMSGGTHTFLGNYAGGPFFNIGAINSGMAMVIFDCHEMGQHPIVLAPDEGIVLRWGQTTLATGSVDLDYVFEWAEVFTY